MDEVDFKKEVITKDSDQIVFPSGFQESQSIQDNFGRSWMNDSSQGMPFLPINDSNSYHEEFVQLSNQEKKSSAETNGKVEQKFDNFKQIMTTVKFHQKNKNTPRFLVDLAIKNFNLYKSEFPSVNVSRWMEKKLAQLRKWHLSSRKNVYSLKHLRYLLSNEVQTEDHKKFLTKQITKINRQIQGEILRKQSINAMLQPKSQIHDKVQYLRVCKIYALRCRMEALVSRNQTQ